MGDVTIIELNPLSAEQFLLFQKYYQKIVQLIECGVFEHKQGSVEIHIDSFGNWNNVRVVRNNYPNKKANN